MVNAGAPSRLPLLRLPRRRVCIDQSIHWQMAHMLSRGLGAARGSSALCLSGRVAALPPRCHLAAGVSIQRGLALHGGHALRRHLCSKAVASGGGGPTSVIFETSKFWVYPLGIFVSGLNGFFVWSLYTSLELGVPAGESVFWTHGG